MHLLLTVYCESSFGDGKNLVRQLSDTFDISLEMGSDNLRLASYSVVVLTSV